MRQAAGSPGTSDRFAYSWSLMVDRPFAVSYYSAPPMLLTRLEDGNETVGAYSLWVCGTPEERGRNRLRLSGCFRANEGCKDFRAGGHKRGVHYRSSRVQGNSLFRPMTWHR